MNIYSVHDHELHGQGFSLENLSPERNNENRSNRDFFKSPNPQETQFSTSSEMPDSPLSHRIAIIQTKSALNILNVIQNEYPRPLLTVEIAEKAKIHRATTSIHAKELVELGLVKQSIKPGTEKKHKPTYLYTISQDVDRDELSKILRIKTEADPSIADINHQGVFTSNFSANSENISESMDDVSPIPESELTEDNEEYINFETLEEQSFEQQVSAILTKMAEEIVSLQNRVAELEQKSTQRVEQRKQLDLSQTLKILNSRNLER